MSLARHLRFLSTSALRRVEDPFAFSRPKDGKPPTFRQPAPVPGQGGRKPDEQPDHIRRSLESLIGPWAKDGRGGGTTPPRAGLRAQEPAFASQESLWARASQPVDVREVGHHGPLVPTSSRTVQANMRRGGGRRAAGVVGTEPADVERAYRRLMAMLNRSGIRREWIRRRRHERAVDLRYRLRSERHRRRFAAEVQRRVSIIQVLRMRGL